METKNCPRCGRLFQEINDHVCPRCVKAEEDLFQNVKTYINDNPMCTLKDVMEETGISHKRILQYVKDGRLEISKGMHGEFKCEKCGKPLTRGKFCESCIVKMDLEVREMFGKVQHDEPKSRTGAKMHTTKKL